MLSLMIDASMPEEEMLRWQFVLAALNGVNTLLIGVATYWKWLSRSEKNRFAADEYDSLRSRVQLHKSAASRTVGPVAQAASEVSDRDGRGEVH